MSLLLLMRLKATQRDYGFDCRRDSPHGLLAAEMRSTYSSGRLCSESANWSRGNHFHVSYRGCAWETSTVRYV